MDPTLMQILRELFRLSQEVDRLEREKTQLLKVIESKLPVYDASKEAIESVPNDQSTH